MDLNYFWDEWFWFPHDRPWGWKDLENSEGSSEYRPQLKDLHWAIPFGLGLIVFRFVLEKDEAVRSSNTPVAKSSVEMENHVFLKAKTREEYLALVARLILHVKDFNNQKREKAQQMQQVAMATGSGLGQVGGMQDPINALQNMAMSGTGMPPGQPQGMMGGSQPMGQMQPMSHPQVGPRQPLLQQQLHGQRQGMPQRPQLQRQDAFIVTSAQPVQPQGTSQTATAPSGPPDYSSATTLPQSSGLSKQSQFMTNLLGQASPQVSTSSLGQGTAPSPAQSGSQQPAGSPLSMMTSPHSMIEPSPVSRSALSVGAPSPSALNTPGNPGSAPSPASQSTDEQAYLEKLKHLSKYVEPLRRMIKKTEKQDDRSKDADHRSKDISKMKNLLDILSNPAKRVPMSMLIKCEQVLEKIQFGIKVSSSSSQSVSAAPTLPTQPTVPASHVHMCQPLLDSVAAHITSPMFNHTLQRTFGPAVAALYGSPIRAPSPPLKKPRVEEKGKIPDLLQGEIARLDRKFKVKLDPMRHTGQKDVHLVCKLDDKYLPSVPPILVTIPEDYPDNSPECSTSGKEYDATPFLRAAQKALVTHLLELPSRFSLTALLDMWEMSVRKACVSPS